MSIVNPKKPAPAAYSAEDIEVLEGLEPVRRRPGMYIGGTDERALHHMAVEVLDNAMDEAVAGHAKRIIVELKDMSTLAISDNGRGIPVDPHPKFPDKSALEVILTTLHSGGKFSQKAYETAGGLHGVGVSVVNALSSWLEAKVYRNQRVWIQTYKRGIPLTPLTDSGASKERGTTITFTPDSEIFENPQFDPVRLRHIIRSKAYLYKGVSIVWRHNGEDEVFHFAGGLLDYLTHGVENADSCTKFATEMKDERGRLECAILWPLEQSELLHEPHITSYCNTIHTPQGGTHESGWRQGMVRALKEYGERINYKPATQITAEDVVVSCQAVLSIFIREPHFQGQTKEKLVNADVSRWVESVLKDQMDHWLVENPQQSQTLLEYIADFARERLQRKQSKDVARQSSTKRLRLPGKLADCTSGQAELCELFLVEGDSAGGSAKQARQRQTQAVLPLKGKILNVATASLEKLKQNQEVSDLILALGCGSGSHLNLAQLRYHKIVIMTDADVDGAHIAALLLTLFYREMRPLLEHGYVYLAQPPLYRLSGGGKVLYALNDAEKERMIEKNFRGKVDVTRFKGLGEMPMQQLRTTTMDPSNRTLLRVTVPQARAETAVFVESLMGKQADARFRFIQERAQFANQLDV